LKSFRLKKNNLFQKILTSNSNKYLRHLFYFSVMSGLFNISNKLNAKERIAKFFNTAFNLDKIAKVALAIRKIDDFLDKLSPESKINLGSVELGDKPSEFLKHEYFTQIGFHNIIKDADKAGIIKTEEHYAISNIHADIVVEQSKAQILSKKFNLVSTREELTETDMKISESSTLHVLTLINAFGFPKKDNKVSLDGIVEKYSDMSRFIRLIECCDHMEDFFIDMEDELKTGNTTPNFVATELHKRGQLLDDKEKINSKLLAFIEENKDRKKPIPFRELPREVRSIINDKEQEYYKEADKLPKFYSNFVRACWDARKREGMMTNAHKRYRENSTQTAQCSYT